MVEWLALRTLNPAIRVQISGGPHFYAQGNPELFLKGAELRREAQGGPGEAEATFGRFEDRCCCFFLFA